MKKVVVALGLSKLSIPQKIETGKAVESSVTGNAYFPGAAPLVATLNASTVALEAASIAAQSGGRDETAAMYAKEASFDIAFKALAAYVETIANGDPANAEAIVLSAGIGLKKTPVPRPNGFRLQAGEHPGEVDARTDFDQRAIFTLQLTLTPANEESWEIVSTGTRASFLVKGLESGRRYYFRVCKTDKDGQGPWSHVLDIIVP